MDADEAIDFGLWAAELAVRPRPQVSWAVICAACGTVGHTSGRCPTVERDS